ncbi:hypothetical protein SO694_00006263 [Aureococcus anophagefferens]|uniref:EF-hand domain-containing protein n=1 Tax=Aureococcus anophagefferens TaxID=44056 RepID=A0ABR1GAE3_AURAN
MPPPSSASLFELRLLAGVGGFASHWLHLCIGLFIKDSSLGSATIVPFFVLMNLCRGVAVVSAERPARLAALHALAAGACFVSAVFLDRGSRAALVFPAAAVGLLDPLTCCGVRIRGHARSGDDAWRDAADQSVWTAFNAGLVASFSGGVLYAALGMRFLCAALGGVAAGLAAVHAREARRPGRVRRSLSVHLFHGGSSRVNVNVSAMMCPGVTSGAMLGVKSVVLISMCATFVTTLNWQLAANYYDEELRQPPSTLFAVLVVTTLLIVNGERAQLATLTPFLGHGASHGPESLLWAFGLAVAALCGFVASAGRPAARVVQMVLHGIVEFYVDFALRCAHRMLDATCEAARLRYEDYAVVRQIGHVVARLYASVVGPTLYFRVGPEAPFLFNVVVVAAAMAYAGAVFIDNLGNTIRDVSFQLNPALEREPRPSLVKATSIISVLGSQTMLASGDPGGPPPLAIYTGLFRRRAGRLRPSTTPTRSFEVRGQRVELDDIDELRAAFDAADADRSGALDRGEALAMLTARGVAPGDAAAIFDNADLDGDDLVDFGEFLKLVAASRAAPTEAVVVELDDATSFSLSGADVDALREKFDAADADGSGALDVGEIAALAGLAPDAAAAVLGLADGDGSGHVEFPEFLRLVGICRAESEKGLLARASSSVDAGDALGVMRACAREARGRPAA